MKDLKIVKSPELARKLLKLNYTVVDIKPDKSDKCKTVFLFKNEKNLEYIISEYANYSK